MPEILLLTSTMIFLVRANMIRKFWRLPMKNGEEYFLAQRVGPEFYRQAGAVLLKRYRGSLTVPLLLDIPLSSWLVVTQRYDFLLAVQFILMLTAIVVYNVLIAHFSYRAQAMVGGEQDPRPTTMQLSMSPRRLRDHTNRMVELVILAAMLVAVGLFARLYANSTAYYGDQAGHVIRGGVVVMIWIFYLQVGLLLLKIVVVRWRMPLPARRTEDFRQWRSAWLQYHLKVFDSVRVCFALVLVSGMWIKLTWKDWSGNSVIVACSIWIPAVVSVALYLGQERRRLAAAERELRPIEMVKEFPRPPIPQGRFLAGGLLYFNRDNPAVLVRSTKGIAVNLAQPTAYVWPAYFIGLGLLTTLTMTG